VHILLLDYAVRIKEKEEKDAMEAGSQRFVT
jgi:hypothetical protein